MSILDKVRGLFGVHAVRPEETGNRPTLSPDDTVIIGTAEDPLHGYEAAVQRHEAAVQADNSGDPQTAIQLYQTSVAEHFVGSHPYEALANLHERRHDHPAALQAVEAYITLAHSGHMPPGAQRSANRKLPEFLARAQHLRRPT